MIEALPDRVHTVLHVEIISVGVHVPDAGVACVDGDVAGVGLAQPPGLQQQLADRAGLCVVVALGTACDRVPLFTGLVAAGVLTRQHTRVLARQVQRCGHAATEQHLGGLLLNLVQRTDLSGEIHRAIEAVQSGEQFAPLKKSVA